MTISLMAIYFTTLTTSKLFCLHVNCFSTYKTRVRVGLLMNKQVLPSLIFNLRLIFWALEAEIHFRVLKNENPVSVSDLGCLAGMSTFILIFEFAGIMTENP